MGGEMTYFERFVHESSGLGHDQYGEEIEGHPSVLLDIETALELL